MSTCIAAVSSRGCQTTAARGVTWRQEGSRMQHPCGTTCKRLGSNSIVSRVLRGLRKRRVLRSTGQQLGHRADDDASSSDRGQPAAAASSSAVQVEAPDGKHFWRVVVPTGLTMLLCNMDRICMSIAILPMSQAFGWSPSVQGVVQAAFLYGYTVTQLLGGSLADKYGGRRVIAYAIKVFSAASLVLPLLLRAMPSATLACVVATRFLVGVGEGVVLPSMNALVATTVAKARKSTALGAIFSCFHCGNLVGLAASPHIIAAYGWQALFVVFGALGAPLLLLWYTVMPREGAGAAQQAKALYAARDPRAEASAAASPASMSGRQGGEAWQYNTESDGNKAGAAFAAAAASAEPTSVRAFLKHEATIAIIVANFVNHWGYFIFLSWIPAYFANVYGLDLKASALFSFAPWIAMALGSSLAGLLADALVQRFEVERVRKGIQVFAFLAPAAAMLSLTGPGLSSTAACALFVAALGMQSLGQAGFVANMSDIAPQDSGKLFGLCNTFGSAAGIVGVQAAGVLYEATGSFTTLFQLTAVLYLVGAACFWAWARADPIFGEVASS